MTAHGLISQALGLQASYLVLKDKSTEVLLRDIDRKLLISNGLTQSSTIILSFAVEIALKSILKHRFDSFPKIHNLKQLYKKLNANDRLQISKIYKQKANSDIEECLEVHKDLFMRFRYLEGETGAPVDNEKVNILLSSIIKFYNEINSDS